MKRSALPTSRNLARVIYLAIGTVLLGTGIAGFWPWISDDAFISLRYAERLARGDGLTWNDGEAVEGYSNLLWILLTVLCRPFGLDWVAIVRGLGIAATFATVAVLAFTSWPLADVERHRRCELAPGAMALVVAALAPIALWAIGGLEMPLALLLTTVGFAGTGRVLWNRDGPESPRHAAWLAGIAFALLAWTRPDGPLAGVLAALTVAMFVRRDRWRTSAVIGLPVAFAVLAQLAFRLLYHGDYVPNTAHAKVGTSAASFALGWEYLKSCESVLRGLLVPAAIGVVVSLTHRRARPFALLVLGFVAVFSGYTASVGGDLFPLCRLVLPTFGPLALVAGLGFALLAQRGVGQVLAAIAAVFGVGLALVDRTLDPEDPYQQISDWEWRGEPVGRWLAAAFGDDRPLLALDAAGGVPFYSGLRCLDMLGLNDRHIARAPLPAPDHVIPGHSRGDGEYVLDRAPDLVLFASPTGEPSPRWPGAWQMERDPRFLRDYRCVICRTGPVAVRGEGERDLEVTLWVRLGGRVGLRAIGNSGAFELPGYLLGCHRQPVPFHRYEPDPPPPTPDRLAAAAAMLGWAEAQRAVGVRRANGAVAARFDATGRFVVEALPLPTDRAFDIAFEPADAAVRLELRPTRVAGGAGMDLVVTVPEAADLPVVVDRIRFDPR